MRGCNGAEKDGKRPMTYTWRTEPEHERNPVLRRQRRLGFHCWNAVMGRRKRTG
jgi:hypothetical protein